MLEKLLGTGFFGGSIYHLACHQTTHFIFSGGFGLHSRIWIVAPTFLRCWALITFALIICFQ
jgi:hypothetical protein